MFAEAKIALKLNGFSCMGRAPREDQISMGFAVKDIYCDLSRLKDLDNDDRTKAELATLSSRLEL